MQQNIDLLIDTASRWGKAVAVVSLPIATAASPSLREAMQVTFEVAMAWAGTIGLGITVILAIRKYGFQVLKFWKWGLRIVEGQSPRMNKLESMIMLQNEINWAHIDRMPHVNLFESDLSGDWTRVSTALIRMFGAGNDNDMLGLNWQNYIDETEAEAIQKKWRRCVETLSRFEATVNLIRGIEVHISAHPEPEAQPFVYVGHVVPMQTIASTATAGKE